MFDLDNREPNPPQRFEAEPVARPPRPATASRRLGILLALALAGLLGLAPGASAEIYWANSGNGTGTTIGKATIDEAGNATDVNQSFITGLDYPRGVAANSSHLYWSQGAPDVATAAIGRHDLQSGETDRQFIMNSDCETPGDQDLRSPLGVAIDSTHIYWVDSFSVLIGRARLDGSEVDCDWVSLPNPGYAVEWDLAVDDQYVYWTQREVNDSELDPPLLIPGKIGRVSKSDPGDPDPEFKSPLGAVQSVTTRAGGLWWYENATSLEDRGICNSTACPYITLDSYSFDLALTDEFFYYSDQNSIGRVGIDGADAGGADFITGADVSWGVAATTAAGTLSLSSHDFGSVEIGDEASLVVTLTSTGDAPLTIDAGGITLTGTDPSEFTLVDGTGLDSCQAGATSLANGETCTVEVAFEPGSTGAKAATLEVATNAEPFAASLTGTGVPPAAPSFSAVRLSSKAKRVKAPRKGKKKVPVTVRVTNSGDAVGTATVSLRSSSRKVRVPRRLTVQVGAGSARSRSFKATVLPRAPRKATVTATLPDGRKARLVLKIRR